MNLRELYEGFGSKIKKNVETSREDELKSAASKFGTLTEEEFTERCCEIAQKYYPNMRKMVYNIDLFDAYGPSKRTSWRSLGGDMFSVEVHFPTDDSGRRIELKEPSFYIYAKLIVMKGSSPDVIGLPARFVEMPNSILNEEKNGYLLTTGALQDIEAICKRLTSEEGREVCAEIVKGYSTYQKKVIIPLIEKALGAKTSKWLENHNKQLEDQKAKRNAKKEAEKKEIEENAIQFEDEATKQIILRRFCPKRMKDVSPAYLSKINGRDLYWFSGEKIVLFDEFKYFTGIEYIPEEAFEGCTKLEKITLPHRNGTYATYAIDGRAFANCRSLQEIVIPSCVSSIEWEAFINCRSLKKVTFEDGALKDMTDDDSSFDAWFKGCAKLEEIVNAPAILKNHLKEIGVQTKRTKVTFAKEKMNESLNVNPFKKKYRIDLLLNESDAQIGWMLEMQSSFESRLVTESLDLEEMFNKTQPKRRRITEALRRPVSGKVIQIEDPTFSRETAIHEDYIYHSRKSSDKEFKEWLYEMLGSTPKQWTMKYLLTKYDAEGKEFLDAYRKMKDPKAQGIKTGKLIDGAPKFWISIPEIEGNELPSILQNNIRAKEDRYKNSIIEILCYRNDFDEFIKCLKDEESRIGWKIATASKHEFGTVDKFGLITLETKIPSFVKDSKINTRDVTKMIFDKYDGKMYHVTLSTAYDKIRNIGLIPRANNKIASHYERIYAFLVPKSVNKFASLGSSAANLYSSRTKDSSVKVTVLEIDLKKVPKTSTMPSFYQDPMSQGVFTYENISSKAVTFFAEFEVKGSFFKLLSKAEAPKEDKKEEILENVDEQMFSFDYSYKPRDPRFML